MTVHHQLGSFETTQSCFWFLKLYNLDFADPVPVLSACFHPEVLRENPHVQLLFKPPSWVARKLSSRRSEATCSWGVSFP